MDDRGRLSRENCRAGLRLDFKLTDIDFEDPGAGALGFCFLGIDGWGGLGRRGRVNYERRVSLYALDGDLNGKEEAEVILEHGGRMCVDRRHGRRGA